LNPESETGFSPSRSLSRYAAKYTLRGIQPKGNASRQERHVHPLGLTVSIRELEMAKAFRVFAAIIAGMVVAFILVVAVELFSAVVHPVPPDFKGTMEEMCLHVARYPQWVLAVVVPAWAGTAFVSTWLSGRLGNRFCALFIGILLLAAVIYNLSMLPYPLWFKVANLLAIPTAILLGDRLSIRRESRG
jgi:hypothetical protein